MGGWDLLCNWLHLGWHLLSDVEWRATLHVGILRRGGIFHALILIAVHQVLHVRSVLDLGTLESVLLHVDAHYYAYDFASSILLLGSRVDGG